MTTTRKRSSSPSAVAKTALEQATLALSELPEKPRDVWSLKEAVEFMHESITAALDRGYSYEEVAGMLNQNGVDIRAASLKYYLTAIKREQEPASKPKVRRPRKAREGKAVTADPSSAAMTSVSLVPFEAPTESPAPASLNGATAESEATPATPAKKRTRSTAGTSTKSTAAKPTATTKTKTAAKIKATPETKSRATAKPKTTATKTSPTKATKTVPTRRRKKADASPE